MTTDADAGLLHRVVLPAPYYQRDGVTLYHGNALEILPALRFDLMLTDPPYGIALENHARGKERSDTDWTIENDDSQETGQSVLDSWGGATIAFSSPMKPWAGKWRQHLVWEKGEHVGGGGDPTTCWKPTYELIQVRNTGPLDGRRDGSVLRFRANKADYRFHPTPKPIALIEYLLCKVRPKRVCDPFSGGGSTLVAAKLCGIEAVGVEIDRRHCDTIVRRLSQGVLF
jgi:site-specific DNA-methyltransferase (adenine-specific)